MVEMKHKILPGQLDLFEGSDRIAKLPVVKLSSQISRIYTIMSDGIWRTARELEHFTGYKQSSIRAQLRNLRKPMYGSHIVEVRLRGPDLHEYKVFKNFDIRVHFSSVVTT